MSTYDRIQRLYAVGEHNQMAFLRLLGVARNLALKLDDKEVFDDINEIAETYLQIENEKELLK